MLEDGVQHIDRPLQVFTDRALSAKQRDWSRWAWRPQTPIRWLESKLDVDLFMRGVHHVSQELFTGVVQYRVNRTEWMKFGTLTMSELMRREARLKDGDIKRSIFEIVKQRLKVEREEVARGFGVMLQIDAIYHDSFVALPYEWGCRRDQVFAEVEVYEQLLEQAKVVDILRGAVMFAHLEDLRSNYIAWYATPNQAVWRVGDVLFHHECWKRDISVMTPGFDWAAPVSGWSEEVTPFVYPEGLEVDPDRLRLDIDGRPVMVAEGGEGVHGVASDVAAS